MGARCWRQGRVEIEVIAMPVGPYETMEECVADNQDKDDPGAFCGSLKEQSAADLPGDNADGGAEMSVRRQVRVSTPATRGSFAAVTDEEIETMNLAVAGDETRWEGVIAVEERLTGDGRMFTSGALRWETLPVPLRWVREDVGEHDGAVVVGRIDEVYRDGNTIMGRGIFDTGSEAGIEAARQVAEGLTPGISVDLDDVSFEIRVRESVLQDDDSEGIELDDSGMATVMRFDADDEVMVTTDARLRAATIVATPAFAEARIAAVEDDEKDRIARIYAPAPEVDMFATPEEAIARAEELGCEGVHSMDENGQTVYMPCASHEEYDELAGEVEDEVEGEPASIRASSVGTKPPAGWFRDPDLAGSTPITVTEDGRVFGHLATWGTCHTGFVGECVQPPSSASDYAYFRTGSVRTDDGSEVAVGRLTLDTTHAGRRLGATDTAAHYEHTGVAVADVSAGEDVHGIWVAGALRPGVSEEQVRALMASPLSGDWRRIGGQLELVAALAVNSPGFPIPRVLVAGGSVQTLQASGVVTASSEQVEDLSGSEDKALLARLIERERAVLRDQRKQAAAARNRIRSASAQARFRRAIKG